MTIEEVIRVIWRAFSRILAGYNTTMTGYTLPIIKITVNIDFVGNSWDFFFFLSMILCI